MDKDTTGRLLETLRSADIADVDRLEAAYVPGGPLTFAGYMDALLREKKLKRQDVFQKADLPQKYGYKLLSGESHTTDRDKLLRVFLAMGLTLRETQRALALYGLPALYPRFRRDAALIIAFNTGVSSVDTVNEWLAQLGEPELSPSGE